MGEAFAPFWNDYAPTILAIGAMGGLQLIQLVVVDVAGIRAKHPPGTPVAPDPSVFHFRAVRAHANTNESIGAFLTLVLFGLLAGASPAWTNAASVAWVAARAGHAVCYWAGWAIARSTCFAIALVSLVALFAASVRAVL